MLENSIKMSSAEFRYFMSGNLFQSDVPKYKMPKRQTSKAIHKNGNLEWRFSTDFSRIFQHVPSWDISCTKGGPAVVINYSKKLLF